MQLLVFKTYDWSILHVSCTFVSCELLPYFFPTKLPFFFLLREIALQAVSSAPLFSRPKRSVQPRQVYPYVFDALASTHQATAFISDTKVLFSVCICIVLPFTY